MKIIPETRRVHRIRWKCGGKYQNYCLPNTNL